MCILRTVILQNALLLHLGGILLKKGIFWILVSAALFSSAEIALKLVNHLFNPLQINFLRFFIGSLVLLPFAFKALKDRHLRLKGGDFAFFALAGFVCVVVSMVFYQMSIEYLQASVVAVLFCCNPVFVVLFAMLLLHEKIYRHTVISLMISIAGMAVIIDPFHVAGNALGFTLLILSTVTFGLYSVICRRRSERYGGVALTGMSLFCGSMEMLPLLLLTRAAPVAHFFTKAGLRTFADVPIFEGITLRTLPSLLLIGALITGVGYLGYFLAMEKTSTVTASLVFFIKPALAPVLAMIVIAEPITPAMLAGILLIVAGSAVSFIPDFRLQRQKEKEAGAKAVHLSVIENLSEPMEEENEESCSSSRS